MKGFRLIPLLLVGLLSVPLVAQADFSDVTDDTSYSDSIEWMNNNGVINGHPDGRFAPDDCVNRADFLKMLYTTLEVDVSGYDSVESSFSDVPDDAYYSNYVKHAWNKGAVMGYEDGTFKPGQCMTRAEAIKVAILEFNDSQIPEFEKWWDEALPSDVSEGDWFYDYMDYALWTEIVGEEHMETAISSGNEYFFPNESITRKEVSEMLYRTLTVQDNGLEYYYSWYNPYPLSSNLVINSCDADSGLASVDPEYILPADSEIVLAFDASNANQLSNWEQLMDRFPSSDLWDMVIEEYDASTREDLSYANTLGPIFENDWKLVMGFEFDEGFDFETSTKEDMEIVLAGNFEAADEFEYLFGLEMQKSGGVSLECSVQNGIAYWTDEEEYFYYARKGDLFVLANSRSALGDALYRAEHGGGYEAPKSDDNLGFVHIELASLIEMSGDLFDEVSSEFGTTPDSLYLDELSDLYASWSVGTQSFRFNTWLDLLTSDGELGSLYADYETNLTDVLPGADLLAYVEAGSLNTQVQSALASLGELGYGASDLNELLTEVGVELSDLTDFLDNPYAFAIYDLDDQLYPSGVFAIDLNDSGLNTGNDLSSTLDGVISESFDALNAEIAESGISGELFVLDTPSGGQSTNLRSAYLDTNSFDEDTLAYLELAYGAWIQEGFELHYGTLPGDNTFVIAFYPDFDDSIDGYSVSEGSQFERALDKLEDSDSYIGYVDVESLTGWIDSFIREYYFYYDEDYLDDDPSYSSFIEIMGQFDYFISGSDLNNDTIHSYSYLHVDGN